MQARAAISDSFDQIYTLQIPVKYDLLQSLNPGRPNKERRPIDYRGRVQFLEQPRRTLLEPGEAHFRHDSIQLLTFTICWWGGFVYDESPGPDLR